MELLSPLFLMMTLAESADDTSLRNDEVPVVMQTPEVKQLLREPDVPPHLKEQSRKQYAALMAYAAGMDPDEWYTSHGHGD